MQVEMTPDDIILAALTPDDNSQITGSILESIGLMREYVWGTGSWIFWFVLPPGFDPTQTIKDIDPMVLTCVSGSQGDTT